MEMIRPWLMIGRYTDSADITFLRQYNIKSMLQLQVSINQPGVETLHLPIKDGVPISTAIFDKALTFIRTQYEQGNNLLISCEMGMSRAPIIAMLALMDIEGCSIIDAYYAIYDVNPFALPHPQLVKSLIEYTHSSETFVEVWSTIHRYRDSKALLES